MKGGRRLESILHERYASKRLASEWFALSQEDLEEIKSWHCPTCGGGKHETHDPIDRLISEWFTTAQQAQAKLDEETVKAQARAWFRADPAEYVSGIATFYKMIENKGDFFSGVAPHLAHERVYFTVETDLVNSVTCKSISFEMEKIITHRNRDYRRDIGFMDVCLYGNRTIDFNQQSVCAKFGRDDLKKVEMARSGDFSLAFEVKTTPGSTYDAIRQIKLYKQYIDRPGYDYWVLATTFPISEAEKFALKNEGILWLQLGPKFSKWASEQT
jgi:hypothetical protein